jgi:hypothetical protein
MLDKNHGKAYNLPMRQLGTDPIFSNLIVKKFDRKLHVRLRAASVKYGKSIRNITGEAVALWLKEEKRKEKEKRESKVYAAMRRGVIVFLITVLQWPFLVGGGIRLALNIVSYSSRVGSRTSRPATLEAPLNDTRNPGWVSAIPPQWRREG